MIGALDTGDREEGERKEKTGDEYRPVACGGRGDTKT